MAQKPVKRDDPHPDTAEQVIGEIAFTASKSIVLPPLWMYPYDSGLDRLKKSWWFYLCLLVVSVPLYWELIASGGVWVVLTFPVAHVVILAALLSHAGAAVITGWPWIVPAWLPDQGNLLLLGFVPVMTGIVQAARSTYDLGDNEMVLPMSEIRQKSDGAGKYPKFDNRVSSLLIGETGSGKSSALELLAYQFDYRPDDPDDDAIATIAHDLKRDFWEFYNDNTDLQVERLSIEDSTVTWNLFLDTEHERQFNEIARGVMGTPDGSNPFHKGATQVLADCMIFLHRKGQEHDEIPDHEDLLELLEQDHETLYKTLSSEGFASASSIDPDTGGAKETRSTMMENVRDVFVGDFAESGNFSLREFIEHPDGRAVMIDTKIDEIETTGPMFRLILDLSIKYGMTSDTDVNYILDEIDQLPRLSRLSSLASAGRGVGVRGLIGIQTVGQLRAVYGDKVDGILGNCPQGVYFGPGEQRTVNYVLGELGEEREIVESTTESQSGSGLDKHTSTSTTEREVERSPITSSELKQFRPGDAIVTSRTEWWAGRVELLEDVDEDLDQAGVGLGRTQTTDDLPETRKK